MWFQRFDLILWLIVALLAKQVSCECHTLVLSGSCSFRIRCRGTVQGVKLPENCQIFSNVPVHVDLTLFNASENHTFNENDIEFFASVTTFRVFGGLSETSLPMLLQNFYRLKELYLVDDGITKILDSPLRSLFQLETVDLSHNKLSEIEQVFVFESEAKVKTLSLAHNSIKKLQETDLGRLTHLVILDLSFNQLTDLTVEPFSNLTSLKTLKLNNNNIFNLNGAINNLNNLRHLYLRGNRLANIDEESLNIIKHLETFDVSENQLKILQPRMFSRHWEHFEGGVKIILANNRITDVPNATVAIISKSEIYGKFKRLANLRIGREIYNIGNNLDTGMTTEVDLSRNSIEDIGYNAFLPIVKLISLDLSNNQLKQFHVNGKDLSYLQKLNLSCNRITHIEHDNFWDIINLENLDLSHNQLKNVLESTFYNNHNLKFVNMTHNDFVNLDNLPIIAFNEQGGVLDLSFNNLETLRADARQGVRMRTLYLNFNNITNASDVDLRYPNQLTTLEMYGNNIEELSPNSLLLPATISSLNLSMNNINYIEPSTFSHVRHLKKLFLAQNKLQNFEYGVFQGLSMLETLDMSYNQLELLNSKVLMDLKSLKYLFLGHNGLTYLDDKVWVGYYNYLRIYVDGNELPCSWLSSVLMNFNNGLSMMRPVAMKVANAGPSIEGIPCTPDEVENSEKIADLTDERLLITGHKILIELKEQTREMKKLLSTFQHPNKK